MASQREIRESYFLPYQQRWLADKSRLKLAEKSRRIGWTYVQSFEDVTDAIPQDGGMDIWFSSADESAAEEYIRYCEFWLSVYGAAAEYLGERVIDSERDVKALQIRCANGHRINALTSNPRRFRSKGGKIVLDEFGHHADQDAMWRAASPAATWGYPIRVISTHNGMSCRFYRMVSDAQKGNRWSLHTTTIEDAVREGLVDKILRRSATSEDRAAFLAECRDIAGDEETYLEEYMCVPRDATLAWLSWDLITGCEDDRAGRPELWTGGPTTVGWDIARRRNYSVQWAAERVGDVYWTREIVEMVNRPFSEQEDHFGRLLERFKAYRAAIDQTGMGERSVELMQDRWGKSRVEGVLFSRAGVKQDLAQRGRRMFEDRRVRIPPSRLVRDSHHALRKTVTAAGNIRFEADDDAEIGHGDHAWAHFLALHAADGHSTGPVEYTQVQARRFGQQRGCW